MRQSGDHAIIMQPSCSYDTVSSEHVQQSLCCWDSRQSLQGCTRVRTHSSHGRLYSASCCWRSSVITMIILAGMMHQSIAFTVAGDAQDRAFEDMSMLARAGKFLTVAVSDAASVIGASKRKAPVEQRTLRLANKAVRPKAASSTDCHIFTVECLPTIVLHTGQQKQPG